MRRAHELVGGWMREAGMEVRIDQIGNLIGKRRSRKRKAKTLLCGSHLDTVRDAGRFDGALGVLLALACCEEMRGRELPFNVEVVGFIDEEGVRFQTTYLGSRALAGSIQPTDLKVRDADGITLEEAIRTFGGDSSRVIAQRRDPSTLIGYVEAHIEQGPVLQARNRPLAVVSGIAGQTRVRLAYIGEAGHAGTVPLSLRHDALCAAAEFVIAAEEVAVVTDGSVATVGQLEVFPGASNVIPGRAELTLDLRHAQDDVRANTLAEMARRAETIAARRGVVLTWQVVQTTNAVACDPQLTQTLLDAIGSNAMVLPSGAGHDAAALAALCPTSMLFIRCREGISHTPEEFASEADIGDALEAMLRFLDRLATAHA
jgi:allantoate deiminase